MTEKELKKSMKSLGFMSQFMLHDKWLGKASRSSEKISIALDKIYNDIHEAANLILLEDK